MPNLRSILTTARCSRPPGAYRKPTRPVLSARSLALIRQHRHVSTLTSTTSPESGTLSPHPPTSFSSPSNNPFYFSTGYALFAKRHSRPFPPPFLSLPNTSFSDPLSTHHCSKDGRNIPHYEGEIIRGITNGDDAVLVSETMIAANDGVGAWATKEKGHAALWARLICHFWALEAGREGCGDMERVESGKEGGQVPDMQGYLQRAFEHTQSAVGEWLGTSTASGVLIHHTPFSADEEARPLLYVTHLGDSQILVIRPGTPDIIFKTVEQWHWFDCPRQLGTNSPDTPDENAVSDTVEVEVGDVVLAMTDGVVDNLFEAEIVDIVEKGLKKAEEMFKEDTRDEDDRWKKTLKYIAEEIVKAATMIAKDPYAESPYMERALEEGLPASGGKLDDISVVAATVRSRLKKGNAQIASGMKEDL